MTQWQKLKQLVSFACNFYLQSVIIDDDVSTMTKKIKKYGVFRMRIGPPLEYGVPTKMIDLFSDSAYESL